MVHECTYPSKAGHLLILKDPTQTRRLRLWNGLCFELSPGVEARSLPAHSPSPSSQAGYLLRTVYVDSQRHGHVLRVVPGHDIMWHWCALPGGCTHNHL